MLILTRKIDEKIVIDPDGSPVVVTVLDIRNGKVRLGVEADRAITIHRVEVQDAIERKRNDPERRPA
jgi:carbon storage regulator